MSELSQKVTVTRDDLERTQTTVQNLVTGVTKGVKAIQNLQVKLEQMNANTPPEVDLDPLIELAANAAQELSAALPDEEPAEEEPDTEPEPIPVDTGEDEPEPVEEEPPASVTEPDGNAEEEDMLPEGEDER